MKIAIKWAIWNTIKSDHCPRCEKDKEDWKHIWICENNELTIREVIAKVISLNWINIYGKTNSIICTL